MVSVSVDNFDLERLCPFGSIVVIGAVDRGKSTLIKNITNFF
ncbi:MAG: hypothetical protein ACP5JZ_05215 [Thermosulfidibacteraceae bacterium]|jgi:polynucleotide 5'-kinase involved in rRNA processing